MFTFTISLRYTQWPAIPERIREKAAEILAPILNAFNGSRLVPNTAADRLAIEFTRETSKEMFTEALLLQEFMEQYQWRFGELLALKTYITVGKAEFQLAFMNPGESLLDDMIQNLLEFQRPSLLSPYNP